MQPPFMFQVRLTEESHDFLLREFPSVHPNVFAHHVTLFYKPDEAQTGAMEELVVRGGTGEGHRVLRRRQGPGGHGRVA